MSVGALGHAGVQGLLVIVNANLHKHDYLGLIYLLGGGGMRRGINMSTIQLTMGRGQRVIKMQA